MSDKNNIVTPETVLNADREYSKLVEAEHKRAQELYQALKGKPYVEVIVERDSMWKPKKVEVEDDSVLVKIKPIRFHHDEVIYVPVFQKNFDEDGKPLFSPTFSYSLSMATHDEQMAWSFEPDYVMELRGTFDATTKPFVIKEEK